MDLFKNIEGKTGVSMDHVMELANSLQNADLKDGGTVRQLIQRVSQIANEPVNKQMEDKIVDSIVNGKQNLDFNTIADMLNQNKK